MAANHHHAAEQQRLAEDARRERNWKRWGPYLSERQWGTVREDYSADGNAWDYFPHDQARCRAYRWGEDGLLGICDRECRLCFSVALWNGKDPILKERLFGLTNAQGNHGEDVKEEYFYLDSTPTHSYMKALYKYPQAEFPYDRLVEENARRKGRSDEATERRSDEGKGFNTEPEFELRDCGVFEGGRYFDVFAEYAKNSPDDLLIRITAINRGPEAAMIHLIPQLFYRNTWAWGCKHEGCEIKPRMVLAPPNDEEGAAHVIADHATLKRFHFWAEPLEGHAATMLFTENETNLHRCFGAENYYPNVRDGFHDYVVHENGSAVNAAKMGTKVGAYYAVELAAGARVTIRLRLSADDQKPDQPFGSAFDKTFRERIAEADAFYNHHIPARLSDEQRRIVRQAYAGLLWNKQFYHYIVPDWLAGDPAQPPPPRERWQGRNHDWMQLYSRDVISMPDKWEYPWFAAWDLAFHMVTLCRIDPQFAKDQLILFMREWYMHPQGKIPAYEFNFDDVTPPVHAWACWRVYKITGEKGKRDRAFLARAFQKLLINFTWWVNRKDVTGRNIFGGGFLGMDNIGMFDRSQPLPDGGYLEQADGTAWMACYCATMLAMALELASEDPVYEDVASKFFEHFVTIVDAVNTVGGTGLWDNQDGFYYDRLRLSGGKNIPIRIRSMVGLIPLFAVEVLEDEIIDRLPGFKKRLEWFLKHRADLARFISYVEKSREHGRRLLAVPSQEKLRRMLKYVFDEEEFLSPFGLRSMSKVHREQPFLLKLNSRSLEAHYSPGESDTDLFGGNSNWRGPIWFPPNYLFIEALERYHYFLGDSFKIEYPTGSGSEHTLKEIADELGRRLAALFLRDGSGGRPADGGDRRYASDPHYRDLVLFYEYFHAENGRGLGASHQTGWTALVARLMECRQ